MDATAGSVRRAPLSSYIARLNINQSWSWAWDNFKPVLLDLIRETQARDVCELGGGRTPMFSRDIIDTLGVAYVVNDISAEELSRAPSWVDKAQFDLSAPSLPEQHRERFDLVFSHMLMEHVSDAKRAYRNIYAMLRPGGVFFNFHPVLYSPAMLFNWLMPESLTKRALLLLQPDRHNEGDPKFPARYSYCVVGRRSEEMLRSIGFRRVSIIPFYGNDYLKRIPLLQRLEDRFSAYAMRTGMTYLASLSYTLGAK